MLQGFKTLFNLFFGLSAFILIGCGGSRSDSVSVTPTIRNGQSMTIADIKTVDQRPSLSSSGIRLTYVSGKDQGVLRARTIERAQITTDFGASNVVATSGIFTSDLQSKVSPNGLWVLVAGVTSSGRGLALCVWNGSCSKVADSVLGVDKFDFSPDSSAFYFLTGNSQSAGTLFVAAVNQSTATYQVGQVSQWKEAQFAPVSSGFKLIAVEHSENGVGTQSLYSFTFTSVSGAASATATTIASGITGKAALTKGTLGGSSGTTNGSFLMILRPVKSTADAYFTEIGTYQWANETDKRRIPYSWELAGYNLSNSSSVTVLANSALYYDRVHLASDQSTLFAAARVAVRCKDDGDTTIGSTLSVLNFSGSIASKFLYLKKPKDFTRLPIVTTDACDRNYEGETTSTDFDISDLVVNAGATASSYTVAWTTRMTGDPEVYALDFNGSTYTVRWVSNNRR